VAGSKGKARTRARALTRSLRVAPSAVLFTQDSGFATFSDGRWVAQMIRDIVSGSLDPARLPLLRVVRQADGRLWTLDNRRLYCFQRCGVRGIDVELIGGGEGEEGDGAKNEEYQLKRFGLSNGTTSQGTVLKMKASGGGKVAQAAVAALEDCATCASTAMQRLRAVRFVKGCKSAVLESGWYGEKPPPSTNASTSLTKRNPTGMSSGWRPSMGRCCWP